MTFIETNKDSSSTKDFNSENKEQKRFKSFMFIGFLIVLLPFFYFVISAFMPAKDVSETIKIEEEIFANNNIVNEDVSFNTFTKTLFDEKRELLELVVTKNIFQISSSKPEGFYVMVGSFNDYKNAQKLEKMNPTNYVCYIFEPNYKNFNRVGLFISKDDLRMTENALVEIKNMQPQSWILYNSLN